MRISTVVAGSMSEPGSRRMRLVIGALVVALLVPLVALADRAPASAQEADAPHQLDLAVSFEGDFAIDDRYSFEVFVDGSSQETVDATPPAASASVEIPAILIGDERVEQLVRIEATRAVGFSAVEAEVGWDCGQGLVVAAAIELTVSDASTTTCAVTTYGPWRLQVELDEVAQGADMAATLWIDDDLSFGNPALFSGLFGSVAELRGNLQGFEQGVEWVANELVCDNGTTYPLGGASNFAVEVARDVAQSSVTCTLSTEAVEAPPTTGVVFGQHVASAGFIAPSSAYLQIDDGPFEEWLWFGPGSFSRSFDGARTITVTEWLEPDADWLTTGIECDHGTDVPWVDLGNGRSQATIELRDGELVYCEWQYVYLPEALVQVRVDYPSQPDSPWLDYETQPGWEAGRLMPGEVLELSVPSSGGGGVLIVAPDIMWTIDLVCATPDLISERLASEGNGGEQAAFFRFSGAAGAVEAPELCTLVVEPAEPVTLTWTKVYPSDPEQAFVVTSGERTATLRDGETVSFEVSPDAVYATESAPDGTRNESVVCTLGDESVEFPSSEDGEVGFIAFTEGVAPGSEVGCTSTSTTAPLANVVPLTLVHDGGGAPATFTLQPYGADPIVVTIEDHALVETPRSLQWIAMQAGTTRRFVDVSCDGFEFSVKAPDVALIQPDFIRADAASCTFGSQAVANDAITIRIDGVLNTLDGPVPAFDTVELSHRIGEPFFGPTWPAVDPVLVVTEPVGWRAQLFQCNEGLTDVNVADRLELSVHVDDVPPGSTIDCVLSFVPDFTIPIRFDVWIAEEPGAIVDPGAVVEVGFKLNDRDELVRTVDGVATTVVRHDRGRLGISPQPIAGFDVGFARCYGVFGSELIPNTSWGHWTIIWDSTSEILCELELRPVTPAQLVIESQVDGALGNGGLRFRATAADEVLASEVIDGAGSVTIDVPVGEVSLTSIEPATWTNLSSSCDRDFDVYPTDDGFVIDFRVGERVVCTFVNRLVSQDVGVAGDVTCDGRVDIVDALVIAQYVARLRSGVEACPVASTADDIMLTAADFDASGAVDIIDALQVAQCVAGLPTPACPAPDGGGE